MAKLSQVTRKELGAWSQELQERLRRCDTILIRRHEVIAVRW